MGESKRVQCFWMYHKDYAKAGRLFHPEKGETREGLAKRDWVDCPSKFGFWPGSGGKEVDAKVSERLAQVKSGKLPALDGETSVSEDELTRLRQDNARQTEINKSLTQQLSDSQKVAINAEQIKDNTDDGVRHNLDGTDSNMPAYPKGDGVGAAKPDETPDTSGDNPGEAEHIGDFEPASQ